jgi:hypothetical protein
LNSELEFDYPSAETITNAQKKYILDFFAESKIAIGGTNFMDPLNGYKKYIDVNSLVDYMVISELSMNFDAYNRSCYLYKDNDNVDGRMKYGPLWDYDVAWYYYNNQKYSDWQFERSDHNLSIFRILEDPSFSQLLIDTWHTYRKGFLSNDSIIHLIDSLVEIHKPAIERNYQVWPVLQYDWYGKNTHQTYDDKITPVKTWIINRANWIDENIETLYSDRVSTVFSKSAKENRAICYPNPFHDKLNMVLTLNKPGKITVELEDITGRVCGRFIQGYRDSGQNKFELFFPSNFKPGVYEAKVLNDRSIITNQTIIKIN